VREVNAKVLLEYGFVGLAGVLAWSKLALPVASDPVFGALLAAFVGLEAVGARRGRTRIDRRWLLAAGGLFALAFAIWIPSRTRTGLLCDPEAALQGHAVWHLLCALAAGSIFLYLRSERPATD